MNGNSISLQYCEVAVQNHCMPQFDLFQTQTMAYYLLAKEKLQISISNQRKENLKKFPTF